jgi:ACS family allantoate permease-like MFS transporter
MLVVLLSIRHYLAGENKRRDAEGIDDSYDNAYVQRENENGVSEKVKIDKVSCFGPAIIFFMFKNMLFQEYLDLTDIQNREFRYVL